MSEYIVMKNGQTLKSYKTLPAAKKLADAESAEVFCDGECVYRGTVSGSEDTVQEVFQEETIIPAKYALTAKMNIRKAPSKDAPKLGIAQEGTVVEVDAIENDWLRLTDGTFILYDGGRFARKI